MVWWSQFRWACGGAIRLIAKGVRSCSNGVAFYETWVGEPVDYRSKNLLINLGVITVLLSQMFCLMVSVDSQVTTVNYFVMSRVFYSFFFYCKAAF